MSQIARLLDALNREPGESLVEWEQRVIAARNELRDENGEVKDRLVEKYETQYIELYDATVNKLIADGLNPDLLKSRSVAGLIRAHEDGKWLAVLKYDIGKDMEKPA